MKMSLGIRPLSTPPTRRLRAGGGGREVPMATIEIHEPEVKESKPVSRTAAAVLPKSDLVWGPAVAPRAMFSDSLLEFGQQKKRHVFATTTSFIFNCFVIGLMLI